MIKLTPFTPIQAEHLRRFLAAPERPAGTFSYPGLAGFLFAICCSPEMVPPSDWLPLIFADKDAGYRDREEAQQTLSALMALYNHINQGVFEKEPALPPGCEASRVTMANLEPDAPFSQWARGFGMGHDYLSELWDAYTPDDLDEDLGACMMVLTFFASRSLAEAYRQEMATDKTLDELAAQMLKMFPEALLQYALIGRSISDVLQRTQKPEPARSTKIGRNDPCPCGSGKKYKHCCGGRVH
jgi:uncharacterized protein